MSTEARSNSVGHKGTDYLSQSQHDWYLSQLPEDVKHWLEFEAAVSVSVKQVYEVWCQYGPKTKAILMVTQCRDCEDLYGPNHPDSFTAVKARLLQEREQRLRENIRSA